MAAATIEPYVELLKPQELIEQLADEIDRVLERHKRVFAPWCANALVTAAPNPNWTAVIACFDPERFPKLNHNRERCAIRPKCSKRSLRDHFIENHNRDCRATP
jgi:hypothetical protein